MSAGEGAPHDWRPTAALPVLRHRARMLAAARAFFAARGVLEVETPALSAAAASDPQIESLCTRIAGLEGARYLSTSPEFPMKRLLAAGSGDIYQVCKVFRDAERGRWHNPEFTLIEWYRLGFDDAALMTEVEALAAELLAPHRALQPAERLSYADALRRHAGVDCDAAGDAELARAAEEHGIVCARRSRPRCPARPADGPGRRAPAWARPAVLRLRLPGLAGVAGAHEAGPAAGRGALRAVSGRHRAGERLP